MRPHNQLNLPAGVLCMVGASLCFAIMSSFVKVASSRLPPLESVFFRCLCTLVALIPIMRAQKISLLGDRKGLLAFRGTIGFLSVALGFYAVANLGLGDATVLWKTSVVFTALFSILILGESLTLHLLVLIALSFLGALLIVKPSFQVFNLPGLAGLGAGCAVGLITVTIRELHLTEHPLTIAFAFSFYATLLSFVGMLPTFIIPTAPEWGLLLLLGTAGTVGQIAFTYAFRYAPASAIHPFAFSEVFFGLVLGVMVWREVPDFYSLLGAFLIVGSGIMILKGTRQAGPLVLNDTNN